MSSEDLKKDGESEWNSSECRSQNGTMNLDLETRLPLNDSNSTVPDTHPQVTPNGAGSPRESMDTLTLTANDRSDLIITIQAGDEPESEVVVPQFPQPGNSNTSFPTKLKLLIQGAYRRVTPSPNEMEEPHLTPPPSVQTIPSTSGPMKGRCAQDQLVYTFQVSNNNLANNNLGLGVPPPAAANVCPAHRTGSVESYEEVCRICHDNGTDESFITPCLCKGTMGLVHQRCLERWLGESGKTSCEICNYEYLTKREPKYAGFTSAWHWIRNPINPNDTKNLFFDVACFFILTPLASIAAWLCIVGSQHYGASAQERFKEGSFDAFRSIHYRQIPDGSNNTWTSIGLLTLTGTLLAAYYIWLFVAFRYHYQIFKDWQGRNYQVTVLPVSPELVEAQTQSEANDGGGHVNGAEVGRRIEDVVIAQGGGSANTSKATSSLPLLNNATIYNGNNQNNNDGLQRNA